jgi:histidinol-phosphate aminotransferase
MSYDNRYWSRLVSSLSPYVPGEQPRIPGLIKMNTNEMPYGPSPRVLAAILAEATETLRLYPDPTSEALRSKLAAYHGLQPSEIFVGNGSDEVLAHVFLGLLKHDAPLLLPDISYSFYPSYCRLYEIAHRQVPLDAALRLNVEEYSGDCGAIIIANPNAPTGIALPLTEIEGLVAAHPDVPVVIDEAYIDFGGESAAPLIARYPNLLVVRTFSKSFALAGLRVGYALGQAHLIEALARVKDSFNSYPLDRLAQAGATAALDDLPYFRGLVDRVMVDRAMMTEGLAALGFAVLPSSTNFVFVRHPAHAGEALMRALRERAILVRHFKAERIRDFLRISVGTTAECAALLGALRGIV